MENKCICACHTNTLKRPYAHDIKCCKAMNGYIEFTPPTDDWEVGLKVLLSKYRGIKTVNALQARDVLLRFDTELKSFILTLRANLLEEAITWIEENGYPSIGLRDFKEKTLAAISKLK